MAAGALVAQYQPVSSSRRHAWSGTPEVYFTQAIDNSRLVRVADVKRRREMAQFAIALVVLFGFVMLYAWQHFSAIEYGYRIEQLKVQRDLIVESNRALSLEAASLKDLSRIERLAIQMGMRRPADAHLRQVMPGDDDKGSKVGFGKVPNPRLTQ